MAAAKKKSVKRSRQDVGSSKVEVYDIKKDVEKKAKKTHQWVKKHPWESVGIAALAGALISKVLFGRKR